MAQLDILVSGYVAMRDDTQHVASTVALVRGGDRVVVVDPGMVPSRTGLLDRLLSLGIRPGDVTDVVISHHHPDHTINVALFPEQTNIHDHWAIYRGDVWTTRAAEGFRIADGIHLIETPGHSPQDITTMVETDDGVAALTHLWWDADAVSDPNATDLEALHSGRHRVLELANLIVPGHGAPFVPGPGTPR